MKLKFTLFILVLTLVSKIHAQEVPVIKIDEKEISVKKLKIETSIIGDIAFTTYDMSFFNPNDRVLEGELLFPLGENQSVIRYALDINGSLREAVIVEKEKARVAFESTIRQKIDPALLEKTKGNNYKSRIYPIPAKGYKRIVIGVQQQLILNNKNYYYELPFQFKNKMEEYALDIRVLNQKGKPKVKKGLLSSFKYNTEKDEFQSKYQGRSIKVKEPVLVKIPLNTSKEKVIATNEYFYCAKVLENISTNNKLENNITIFWDTSLSQESKKLDTELELLETYFQKVKNASVKLVKFNLKKHTEVTYSVSNGVWKSLKEELKTTAFDGGTSFDFLESYRDSNSLHIFFTNGLNTLDESQINFKKKTYVVNSLRSANHNVLKYAAVKSGGDYINLKNESITKAFQKFQQNKLQFLGTDLNENIETYPEIGSRIGINFTLLGKGFRTKDIINVYLGKGKDTLKTLRFKLKKSKKKNNYISKIWAQKKLDYLSVQKEENRRAIVKLSKEYQIISPFTSLLVLDRIEDYVTHEITPPNELLEEYNRLLNIKVNDKKERIARLQNDLFDDYDEILEWYSKDYKEIPRNDVAPKFVAQTDMTVNATVERVETNNTSNEENSQTNQANVRTGEGETFLVKGTVSDETGPMPGVQILIKGTTIGTETDFDGNFSISVQTGDVLVYSFVGMKTEERVIENSTVHNIILEENNLLEEVVVIAYGIERQNTYSASVSAVLKGEVSGINVQENENSNISIRGASSISSSTKPLYVVNGELVDGNPKLSPNEIASMYVIKDEDGQKIYGSKAANGVIVITTHEAKSKDEKNIEAFEAMVEGKIELKGWNPDTPYLKELKKIQNNDEAFSKYLELRVKYSNAPSFYIDIADFFKERNQEEKAIQVLSNVAEIELDNYELLRSLAYKFEEYKMYSSAIHMYKQIVELRPEDIQSYRDLALVYEDIGEYQKAIDLLYQIVNGEFVDRDEDRRYEGIETVALFELNKIRRKYKEKLKTNHFDKRLVKDVALDLVVTIDWNHNDTDIDLWVTDPNGEECSYKHSQTKIGGYITNDMTEGFGPEAFMLKKAIKGKYAFEVDYYSSSEQKISGPTTLKVTIYKNYGKVNEIKEVKVIRLSNKDDEIEIGNIIF
ncbi:VIT domain-containing protein [uncultured Tenacibaculum sp.]|uniref:VIT domain-containing protein n=1 Tax=uncultured Tenacibaculum sp. TaxID=174713 RepID=UPI00260F03D4|nr:VIT domain-containing protein [uncultured Tenacibaculum sp.]